VKDRERDRRTAIERYLRGERPTAIGASLGYSEAWFYKWLRRYREGDDEWFREGLRRPHLSPRRTPREIEEIVKLERLSLYNQGLFCGPQAIRWELEALEVRPLPSVRTIARILARHDLTHARTGRYEPRGKKYPALVATRPGDVQQTDFVGPCYLDGPIRFYSLHSVDVATGRCAVEPVLHKGGQNTLAAIWAIWSRLGLPKYQQVDNEMVFYGSPTHPRGMGKLIRLCLLHGVEPCFIPLAEPWRNGVVEKFHDHWEQKFHGRIPMYSVDDLLRESRTFEYAHNSRWRYSKLGGKTPMQALTASDVAVRFPSGAEEPPRHPLPKPEQGRYHVVRFIRSNGVLDLFGEQIGLPPETLYEYVRATIDVAKQRLLISLDDHVVHECVYRLR